MEQEPGVWVEGPDGELVPDYDSTFPDINEGQVVHGTVVRVDKDEVLVDPASLSADLATSVRIESVSFDGKLLAYSVQHGGQDASSVRIFDVDHRRDLPDVLPTDFYEGISFTHDGRSFY